MVTPSIDSGFHIYSLQYQKINITPCLCVSEKDCLVINYNLVQSLKLIVSLPVIFINVSAGIYVMKQGMNAIKEYHIFLLYTIFF